MNRRARDRWLQAAPVAPVKSRMPACYAISGVCARSQPSICWAGITCTGSAAWWKSPKPCDSPGRALADDLIGVLRARALQGGNGGGVAGVAERDRGVARQP